VAVDTVLSAQTWCALADDICSPIGPRAVGAGGQVYFIFPLENDIWSAQDLDPSNNFPKSLYLDFMVNVRAADGQRSMTRVQTSTEIDSLSISRQCEEEQVSSSIGDIIEVDMFLGLTEDEASFDASLVQGLDITRNPAAAHMSRDVSSRAANMLTMLVKGTSSVFTPGYAAEYALEIEDMFSMHFLSKEKKNIVDQMIASDLAFSMQPVPGSTNRLRLVPSDMLLQICPIHATRGEFGCVTRREIQERLHDSVTHPIVEISPAEFDADDSSYNRSSEWLQTQLGGSEYVKDLGYQHSRVMAEKFSLNSRYRRGFMVSPTIPWRQAEMENEGISTSIDLAQQSITVVMVALDQNIGGVFEPVVQVAIPGIVLPLSSSEFSATVQADLESALADEAGTSAESVGVDGASIEPAPGGGGRRRVLLAVAGEWVRFNVTVGFPVTDSASARELADNFVARLRNKQAEVLESVMRRYHYHARAHVRTNPPPARMLALERIPPLEDPDLLRSTEVQTCRDDALFSMDLSSLIPATASRNGKFTPMATCSSRWLRHDAMNPVLTYDSHMTPVHARGPQGDADWALYTAVNEQSSGTTRGYSFAMDSGQQHMHWLWWDMCGDAPHTGNVDADAWTRATDQFAQACCLCRRDYPVHSGNRKRYQHQYSWPVMLDGTLNLQHFDLTRFWLVNPQLPSFRQVPAVAAFSSAHAPPAGWGVSASGNTRYMSCGPGFFLATFERCAPCQRGSFQPANSALECTACPIYTTSLGGAATHGACVCVPGYTSFGAGCVPCAPGLFKTLHGNGACSTCAAGLTSRAGSPAASNCQPPPASSGGTEVHMFDPALGVLAYVSPLSATSIHNRRCAVVDGGLSLSCPGELYSLLYKTPLLGQVCFASHDAPSRGYVVPPGTAAGGGGVLYSIRCSALRAQTTPVRMHSSQRILTPTNNLPYQRWSYTPDADIWDLHLSVGARK